MLILSRRIGQEIVIGDDVRITITGISRGKVTIGVTAPAEVAVLRQELLERDPGLAHRVPPCPVTDDVTVLDSGIPTMVSEIAPTAS